MSTLLIDDQRSLPNTINPATRYTNMPPVNAQLCHHRVQRNPAGEGIWEAAASPPEAVTDRR